MHWIVNKVGDHAWHILKARSSLVSRMETRSGFSLVRLPSGGTRDSLARQVFLHIFLPPPAVARCNQDQTLGPQHLELFHEGQIIYLEPSSTCTCGKSSVLTSDLFFHPSGSNPCSILSTRVPCDRPKLWQ